MTPRIAVSSLGSFPHCSLCTLRVYYTKTHYTQLPMNPRGSGSFYWVWNRSIKKFLSVIRGTSVVVVIPGRTRVQSKGHVCTFIYIYLIIYMCEYICTCLYIHMCSMCGGCGNSIIISSYNISMQ